MHYIYKKSKTQAIASAVWDSAVIVTLLIPVALSLWIWEIVKQQINKLRGVKE